MSQLERLKEEKAGATRNGKKQSAKKPPIVTFHPTAEEREQLKKGIYGISEALDTVSKALEEWASLTLGHKPENGVYFGILRDKRIEWTSAPALSYWNNDLERVLIGLGYALEHRFEGFPETTYQPDLFSDEW